MNRLTKKFLSGAPVELTESSEEVTRLRKTLEGDCCFGDYDVGGRVFWNHNRTEAVCVPPVL